MNPTSGTSKTTRTNDDQAECQMQAFPVPPPAIPPAMAYASSRLKQCPPMPLLMVRPPMQPVFFFGPQCSQYRFPTAYEQMQFNFSCSSGNAITLPSNHGSAVEQSSSVLSSFEVKMSSSVVNSDPCNTLSSVLEAETVVNEPLPSCSEPKCSSAQDKLLEQYSEMVKTALDGCKKAETLATFHQKRPCFKKIDSLCARLKQDLLKTDNVMSNINSQGLAWAVKDFIFVFTRIMNAWIIIKGYVPSKPEGLSMIQRELCPNFLDAFGRWHEVTYVLIQSLIKSFINLNKLAKQQRTGGNIFSKSEEPLSSPGDGASVGSASRDLFGDIRETEALNLNPGAYIRAGIYPNVTCPPPGFEEKPQPTAASVPTPKRVQPTEPIDVIDSPASKYSTSTTSNASTSSRFPGSSTSDLQNMGDLLRKTSTECINWVIEEVRSLEEGHYFYTANFAKNYFPDFDLIGSDMIDLRTVYKKHAAGQYKMVIELLDDLQQIVDTCKRYVEILTQFDLFDPNVPLPENCTDNQCKERGNFPKMKNFIAKMEYLLGNIRKGSTMAYADTMKRSLNYDLESGLGTQRFY